MSRALRCVRPSDSMSASQSIWWLWRSWEGAGVLPAVVAFDIAMCNGHRLLIPCQN